jgi:hypothetical protein
MPSARDRRSFLMGNGSEQWHEDCQLQGSRCGHPFFHSGGELFGRSLGVQNGNRRTDGAGLFPVLAGRHLNRDWAHRRLQRDTSYFKRRAARAMGPVAAIDHSGVDTPVRFVVALRWTGRFRTRVGDRLKSGMLRQFMALNHDDRLRPARPFARSFRVVARPAIRDVAGFPRSIGSSNGIV